MQQMDQGMGEGQDDAYKALMEALSQRRGKGIQIIVVAPPEAEAEAPAEEALEAGEEKELPPEPEEDTMDQDMVGGMDEGDKSALMGKAKPSLGERAKQMALSRMGGPGKGPKY